MKHYKKNLIYCALLLLMCDLGIHQSYSSIPMIQQVFQIAQCASHQIAIAIGSMISYGINSQISQSAKIYSDLEYEAQQYASTTPHVSISERPTNQDVCASVSQTSSQQAIDQQTKISYIAQVAHEKLEKENCPLVLVDEVKQLAHDAHLTTQDVTASQINTMIERQIAAEQQAKFKEYLVSIYKPKSLWTTSYTDNAAQYTHESGIFFQVSYDNRNASAIATHNRNMAFSSAMHYLNLAMQQNNDYKLHVQQQLITALDCMAQLASNDPHERFQALIRLPTLEIEAPLDQYLIPTIDNLLKGYISPDGSLSWKALTQPNNYAQHHLKEFINQTQSRLHHTIIIKNIWDTKQKLKTTAHAPYYPISMWHNAYHAFLEHALFRIPWLGEKMRHHALFQASITCLQHCQCYDFAAAQKIIAQHPSDLFMKSMYEYFHVEFQRQVAQKTGHVHQYIEALYDNQGFYREISRHPRFTALTAHQKSNLAQSPEKLSLFNQQLLVEEHIKNKLMKAWNIPIDAPEEVHQALYTIIEHEDSLLINTPKLIDVVCDLAQSDPVVAHHLLLPNGIIKDLAHLNRTKALPVLNPIEKKNPSILKMLNHVVYLEQATPKDAINYAQKTLDLLETDGKYFRDARIEQELVITINKYIENAQSIDHYNADNLQSNKNILKNIKNPLPNFNAPDPDQDKDKNKKEFPEHVTNRAKHYSGKQEWKEIVKSTKHGAAKYIRNINIKQLEQYVWKNGITRNTNASQKVMRFDTIIGAYEGIETCCMIVKESAGTIHGHPLSLELFLTYIK